MENNYISRLSLGPMLGVIFVILKLCNVITWSWIWVLSPFWIYLILLIIFLIILLLVNSIK